MSGRYDTLAPKGRDVFGDPEELGYSQTSRYFMLHTNGLQLSRKAFTGDTTRNRSRDRCCCSEEADTRR